MCRRHYDAQPERKRARARANQRKIEDIRENDPEAYSKHLEAINKAVKRHYRRHKKPKKTTGRSPGSRRGRRTKQPA